MPDTKCPSTKFDHRALCSVRLSSILVTAYLLLIILKKAMGFNDGIVDLALIFVVLAFTILRQTNYSLAVSNLLKLRSFQAFLAISLYFWLLSVTSYNSFNLILAEYLSVFKWYIYFLLGALIAFSPGMSSRYDVYPDKTIFFLVFIVFLYSIFTYDWMGSLSNGIITYAAFYENSYESLFSYRSVFSIFALSIFLLVINKRLSYYQLATILFTLLFIYMSGNRKALVALLLISLFFIFFNRYRNIINFYKYILIAAALLVIASGTLLEKTVREYSNLEQPRIFTYIKAIQIAYDYFPYGSGPATFASSGSMKNYSPIYKEYGMDSKWGFGINDPVHFHMDTYWAKIIGQYGALGVILFAALMTSAIIEAKSTKTEHTHISPALILFILIALSVTTPLFQRTEIGLFIMLPLGIAVSHRSAKHRLFSDNQ